MIRKFCDTLIFCLVLFRSSGSWWARRQASHPYPRLLCNSQGKSTSSSKQSFSKSPPSIGLSSSGTPNPDHGSKDRRMSEPRHKNTTTAFRASAALPYCVRMRLNHHQERLEALYTPASTQLSPTREQANQRASQARTLRSTLLHGS